MMMKVIKAKENQAKEDQRQREEEK